MDELDYKALEQIPIPEGLEERLSAKIDEWEKEEKQQKPQRHRLPRILSYTAAAACVALVLGVGIHFLSQDKYMNLAEQDTYQDPMVAQEEAQKALTLLAVNLSKGIGHLEKAKALSDKTEETLNEQLNVLK